MNFYFGKLGYLKVTIVTLSIAAIAAPLPLSAETAKTKNKESELKEVTVEAEKIKGDSPFLPDVDGTKIYAGKKTSVINLTEAPPITNNNYRQAFSKTTGLNLSEETTPLVSFGSRGLTPDRAQYIQVLKDGIPITADMYGYPEAYYTPPFQTIDRLEYIRGGAALMYGPQPGGALNFITKDPATDTKLRLDSENVFGSENYFSTYDAATGTVGPMGYSVYFHERQGDGFRSTNSDFEVIGTGIKVTLNQTSDSRLTFNYDEYHEEHGEPGGLSLNTTTNPTYELDRNFSTREYDRFRLERYYGSVRYEKEFSEDTQLDVKTFGGKYRRWSKRQRGGGFGTVPTGSTMNSNDIQEQEFYNVGFEPRIRHNYELFGETHTFSFGTQAFLSHSPRVEERGGSPFADTGVVRKENYRDLWSASVFLENLFRIGKLSITPGVRIENIWQRIQEEFNADKTTVPLSDEKDFRSVPLFGLGIAYELVKAVEVYANLSQSYRPKTFADAVPLGTNQVIDGDLNDGFVKQYDFGVRGKPVSFFNWDVNYFILDFKDQVGTVGNTISNVGDAWHQGIELASELNLTGAYDYFQKTDLVKLIGGISPFIALTLLDAEFDQGPNKGKTPQYAPNYNLRLGTNYNWRERVKLSLLGTMVDDQYADDALTPNRLVPSYKVWDLTAEVVLLKNIWNAANLSLLGGVNNLFDENYYARITSAGIDPANDRNYYGGFKISLNLPGDVPKSLEPKTAGAGYGIN